MAEPQVAVVMGSESDLEALSQALDQLAEFDIACEVHVLSAHRAPDAVAELAAAAEDRGIEVIIAGAGKAAHLAGVIAAKTVLPVIGVPMETKLSGGLDSLLSMVQMPRGVPVATMGTGKSGAQNAGILAAQVLARSDGELRDRLAQHKRDMADKVLQSSETVQRKRSRE